MSETLGRLSAALADRYAIERELGQGGMATVYLAHDVRHDRQVALKVLRPELAAILGAERFLAEIKTTANLHHPHILPLFDSGEADGFLFYVMPYVDDETLRDRLDRDRQLPVDEAVAITTAVAQALQHAHDRGVIHRDIKPANILMQDGQPVVSDFGIALAVGSAGGGTAALAALWAEERRFVPQRKPEDVAHLLADYADRAGAKPNEPTVIRLRRTQEELAMELGTARESVSRAMKTLRTRGLVVSLGGARLQIPEPWRLRAFSRGGPP